MRLQLLADAVRDDLSPVDLGARHRQLTTQRLERGVAHRLVVSRDRSLVLVLRLLDQSHDLPGRRLFVGGDHRLTALLGRDQLHVAVLVVMHLHLERTDQLRLGTAHARLERHLPPTAPPPIAVVVRLELVVLHAHVQCHLATSRLAEYGADAVPIVVQRVLLDLRVQGAPPRFSGGVRFVSLVVRRLFPQVVVAEGLFRARIVETTST